MENKTYVINQLTPEKGGYHRRIIQIYDNKEDAEYVLTALEKVNMDFSEYEIDEKIYTGKNNGEEKCVDDREFVDGYRELFKLLVNYRRPKDNNGNRKIYK